MGSVDMLNEWRGVPLEQQIAWSSAFESSIGSEIECACPICGNRSLHRYYYPQRSKVKPQLNITGALWEWCSACKRYQHYSCRVPEYWVEPFAVDEKKLTASPAHIESMRIAIKTGKIP
jgi:hypothetical protein